MSTSGVVFISGTRKGIGKYLVHHFLKNDFFVEGCSRKPPEWTAENYYHHIADVANENQVKMIFESIKKRHGRLDIVINNAGIASMNHILLTPISLVNKLLETNLKGTILVSRESAKLMKMKKYGRIINFSTVAVPLNLEGEAIYAATKSGIEKFTKIIARELSVFGITCNAIGPTPIDTDLIKSVPKNKIDEIIERQAIKRLGTFEDVANVIDFFAQEQSGFITGQVIYLGGVN
jgi:3-oxoacyl-[acyl-carrier protein] reductase